MPIIINGELVFMSKSMFRPMYQKTNATARTNYNTVCQEDSGYIWIDNKLKSGEVFTEIRILPVIDENGKELIALNPEGGASAELIPATLGEWTACIEVASIWKNGKRTFISSVQELDNAGDTVPGGQTPVMRFMSRIGYKIYEQTRRQELGLTTDIPEHWFAWRLNGTISKPQNMYIVRALTNYVNGESVKDSMGQAEWVPGVFAIPKSSEEKFIQDICTRMDADEDLSLQNNDFGDFCSASGGVTLRLKRYDKTKEGGKRTFTTYSLNKGRPMPLDIETVRGMQKGWEEVLYTPTVDECVKILVDLFEPSAIDYAFRGSSYVKYISESIVGQASTIGEAGDVRKLNSDPVTEPAEVHPPTTRVEAKPAEVDQATFASMAAKLQKQVGGGLVE